MPYLDRAGTRIYYQVTGSQGGQPPLLLSHGFSDVDQPEQFNQSVLAFLSRCR